ncbi:MAG: c-type cytochrome domain-containing protein, partial [Imperialibacter sp.]
MPGCSDSTSSGGLPETVSYNFHIRPLMSDRCFACHGPDKNKVKAGLRLDIPELAFAELKESKGKFAIVPGKPEESELVKRISSADPA